MKVNLTRDPVEGYKATTHFVMKLQNLHSCNGIAVGLRPIKGKCHQKKKST